ncbi:hypothetical protein Agub_g8712, partial [Astrephomene gubernaculifera]
MNGALGARILGAPAVAQPGLHRIAAPRTIAVFARRARKVAEEQVEDAPTPAAELVAPEAAPTTRSRKPKTTAAVEEQPGENNDAPAKPKRAIRAKAENVGEDAEVVAEVKPKRASRKKASDGSEVSPEGNPSTPEASAGTVDSNSTPETAAPAKPKRASRTKSATAESTEQQPTSELTGVGAGGESTADAAAAKPKAKRTSTKKSAKEPLAVVSTRGRRGAAQEDEEEEEEPQTAASIAAKRRASARRGGRSGRPAGPVEDPLEQSLADAVLKRSEAGTILSVDRGALGMGRRLWYAVGVTPGMEKLWATQMQQRLDNTAPPMTDLDTGKRVPAAQLISLWVPERKSHQVSLKSGNIVSRKVVYKEGWVLLNAVLSEEVIRLVEGSFGFTAWRGLEERYYDEVGSVQLIVPVSEEAVQEMQVWEATEEPEPDEQRKQQLILEAYGDAGGEALGQSERLDEREGATELDEQGRTVYRNTDYTGGRDNPSNWYEGGAAAGGAGAKEAAGEAAAAENEVLSYDARGTAMAFAPEPEPRRNKREPRSQQKQQQQGQGQGQQQPWQQQQPRDREWGRQDRSWTTGPAAPVGAAAAGKQAGRSFAASAPAPAAPPPDLEFEDEEDWAAPPQPRSQQRQQQQQRQPPASSRGDRTGGLGRIDGPDDGLDMDAWFKSSSSPAAASSAPAASSRPAASPVAAAAAAASKKAPEPPVGSRKGQQSWQAAGNREEEFGEDGGDDEFGIGDALGGDFDDEGGFGEREEELLDAFEDEEDVLGGGAVGSKSGGVLGGRQRQASPKGGREDADGLGADFDEFDFDLEGDDDDVDGLDGDLGGGYTRFASTASRQQGRGQGQGRGAAPASAFGSGARQQKGAGGMRRTGGGFADLDPDFEEDMLGALDDMDFGEEDDGFGGPARGKGSGGRYLDDAEDLDFGGGRFEDWDAPPAAAAGGSRRAGAGAGGRSSYGAAAGGKLGASGDELYDMDDWAYSADDVDGGGGGFGGGLGSADPFDMELDPWARGGGGGGGGYSGRGGYNNNNSRDGYGSRQWGGRGAAGGGRSGGYRSGGGGGGRGYGSGSGPSYDDAARTSSGKPAETDAGKPGASQGEGSSPSSGNTPSGGDTDSTGAGSGSSWRQGGGGGRGGGSSWGQQQGGSGYGNRGYQGGGGRGGGGYGNQGGGGYGGRGGGYG